MSVPYLGNIELQRYNGSFFSDALAYDMLVFTSTHDQRILLGTRSNETATLRIGEYGRVRTTGERLDMRFDGGGSGNVGASRSWSSNGLCVLLDATTSNSALGLVQFPDISASRMQTSGGASYLLGRGDQYADRALTLVVPDMYAYGGTGVHPSIQMRTLDSGSTPMLCARSDGRVGIMTSSPRTVLEVDGDTMMGSGVTTSNASGGPFFVQRGWGASNSNHSIDVSDFGVSRSGHEGSTSGMLFLHTRDGDSRIGHMQLSFAKRFGSNANLDVYVLNKHRSDALTNFEVTTVPVSGGAYGNSSNALLISTDEECQISWTCVGSR